MTTLSLLDIPERPKPPETESAKLARMNAENVARARRKTCPVWHPGMGAGRGTQYESTAPRKPREEKEKIADRVIRLIKQAA